MESPRASLRAALRWNSFALPVLLLLAVSTAVLYWRAFSCGLISDAWELLVIADLGLPEALFVPLSYHVIPVTHLITTILWKVFGLWEPGYQIVNLAELGFAAWMVYFLGLRLFGRPLVALLAALLLLANASFYEVTFWPVIGNFQIVAGLLQLAGLYAAHRAVRSARPALWAGLFGLAAVLAFFTYEPAVSLLPAGILYAALVPPAGQDRSFRAMWRRAMPLIVAAVLAFLPMLAAKIHAASSGHTALFFPDTWDAVRTRLHFLVRGVLSIFSLRGADPAVYSLFYPGGLPPAWGTPYHHVLIVGWLAVMGLASLYALFKSREPAVPFLILWFWIHVVVVSIATTMVSRQYFLAAIPAALLLARMIFGVSDALARRFGREPVAASTALAFLAFGLLAAGAKTDLDGAARLHRESTLATRGLRELVARRLSTGPLQEVALLNLPGRILQDGLGAYSFVNGTRPMLHLTLQGAVPNRNVNFYTLASADPGMFANGTRPITLAELDRMIEDRRKLVLWFDPRSRTMVELNRASWQVPEDYTAATAPFMAWQAGSWPWFRVRPELPMELPLVPDEPGSWVLLKFLRRDPALSFDVTEGGAPRLEIRPRPVDKPTWPVVAFPLSEAGGTKVLGLRTQQELWVAGLWSFTPPESYTPANSPFLPWWLTADPVLVVQEPLRLPVSTSGCPRTGCSLAVLYLAEPGREFSVFVEEVEGVERQDLVFREGAGWRTVEISTGSSSPAVIRIEPRGPQPAFLRTITRSASSNPVPETDTLAPGSSTANAEPERPEP